MFTQGDSPILFITLDKPTYCEGSQVNGTIILNTMMPLQASFLKLTFNGEELVKFTRMESNPRYTELTEEQKKTTRISSTAPRHYKSKQCFYNTEQLVQRFRDDVILPGQYQFPFSFLLGSHIPNTFEHLWKTEEYQNEAMISYNLVAKLTNRDNYNVGRETVKYLVIQNEQQNRASENKKIDQLHHVYDCCCSEKGNIRVVTYFEKDWYYNDEEAYIICEIDNSDSKMIVSKVHARLNQTIQVKAEGYTEENKHEIYGESLEVNLQSGKKMTGSNAIRLKVSFTPQGKNKANTSVEGDLIKCSHSLSVSLSLNGCCQSIPSHFLPIKIYERPPQYEMPSFGGNFAPQRFAPYTFTPERSGRFENGATINYPSG